MVKRLALRISGGDWRTLHRVLLTPDRMENAAALLCGQSSTDRQDRLLVREIMTVPPEQYIERQPYHLEVAPSFYNALVDRCEKSGLVPVICHSHPFDDVAAYSQSDDFGERRLLPILKALVPGHKAASLLLTKTSASARFLAGSRFRRVASVTITGPRVMTLPALSTSGAPSPDSGIFDRQLRAFGRDGQSTLEALTVAIVGVGGIGSMVADQLVRAGVRNLILVDSDVVERSNLNRLVGATEHSCGKPKAKVIAKHLTTMRPVRVDAISDSVIKQSVLTRLRVADLIVGCVDSDLARSILTRFAHQYLTPLVDMGIRLDARDGQVTAAAGRISVVGADGTCLRCSHHINSDRIRAESLAPAERADLVREGYVMGINEPAPAIASLNCVVAGLGATAAINLFVNLTGNLQPPSQLYDATSGIVFTADSVHERGCDICDNEQGVKALGDLQLASAYD